MKRLYTVAGILINVWSMLAVAAFAAALFDGHGLTGLVLGVYSLACAITIGLLPGNGNEEDGDDR